MYISILWKLAFLGAASVEHIELVHKAFYLMCVTLQNLMLCCEIGTGKTKL